jgi:hypothetical protein
MGDESWIFWKNGHRGTWAQDKTDVLARAKRMISSKIDIIDVFSAHWLHFL